MAITVTNDKFISNDEYRRMIEKQVNETFSDATNNYLDIPIMSTAYRNNGKMIFPVDVCRDLLPELKRCGFYCYFSKPSYHYYDWTDFRISKILQTSLQGNLYRL